MLGCPLDRQVALEKDYSFQFVTAEQAEKRLEDLLDAADGRVVGTVH